MHPSIHAMTFLCTTTEATPHVHMHTRIQSVRKEGRKEGRTQSVSNIAMSEFGNRLAELAQQLLKLPFVCGFVCVSAVPSEQVGREGHGSHGGRHRGRSSSGGSSCGCSGGRGVDGHGAAAHGPTSAAQ